MPIIIFALICLFPLDALAADVGYWNDLVLFVRDQQLAFHRELADAIRAIQNGGIVAAWGLVVVSFLYGIFHAAGPGHGKTVIATYVVTHESLLKRVIALSFGSAFVQGLSAIVIVQGFVGLVGLSNRDAQTMTRQLEQVSFLLIAVIGLVLLYRVGKVCLKKIKHKQTDHHHDHQHHHEHDHDHDHECSVCGHSHAPDPTKISDKNKWKDSLAIIFSVGIRPCSGSVLVLIFAQIIGLKWAGVGAVFAISLGTAITVSMLAIMAVYFRKAALMMSAKYENNYIESFGLIVGLIGALVITFLGVSLFLQTMVTNHPLF
ncbi:MAG: nickel/cobalt transporter [Methylocystaceae bacterium]|nr:nickel/cobalt transporter [Methylocystaceae bacterium]